MIHIGEVRREAGRRDDPASVRLAERIAGLGLPLGRLKTGTPPRLDGRTIDWDAVGSQPGDDEPVMFSFLSGAPVQRQIACGVTATNPRTHDIIRANIGRSAMYGGHIAGVGPRYCPSIEDKVVRFAEREFAPDLPRARGPRRRHGLPERHLDLPAAGGSGSLCPDDSRS